MAENAKKQMRKRSFTQNEKMKILLLFLPSDYNHFRNDC